MCLFGAESRRDPLKSKAQGDFFLGCIRIVSGMDRGFLFVTLPADKSEGAPLNWQSLGSWVESTSGSRLFSLDRRGLAVPRPQPPFSLRRLLFTAFASCLAFRLSLFALAFRISHLLCLGRPGDVHPVVGVHGVDGQPVPGDAQFGLELVEGFEPLLCGAA